MKTKNLFITLGLALTLGAGVVAGVAMSRDEVATEANAVTYDYDVYVDIAGTSNYTGDVYCHNWGTSGTTWPGTKMTLVSGTIYGVNLKNSANTGCIFHNNSGKQTGDLTIEKHKVFIMESDTGGGWQDLDEYFDLDHQAASSSTMRLFVNNSDLTNWSKDDAETRIRCWGSASYTWVGGIYDLNWFQNSATEGDGASGNWYGYADVPTDITGFAVVRCNKTVVKRTWNYAPTITVDGTAAVAARIYKVAENDWTFSYSATVGDSKPGVALMTNIINAYDTCSSSKLNGWGAYTDLNTNFFSKATAKALAAQTKSLNGTTNFSIQDHINGLSAGASAGKRTVSMPSVLLNESNNVITIVAIASVASLVAVGGFFFIRKRRENN